MRILVVEDETVLRTQLAGAVQAAGYAVDTAENGESADFLGQTEAYDAAILDLGLPAVDGPKDAALLIRAVRMAEHGDEKTIRILGIDHDFRNLLAVAKTGKVRPGLTGICRFVDAVADRQVRALQALTAADVNDIGIGGGHRNTADRAGRLFVEDWRPGVTVVRRFPNSAVHRCHIKDIWFGSHARHGSEGGVGADSATRRTEVEAA